MPLEMLDVRGGVPFFHGGTVAMLKKSVIAGLVPDSEVGSQKSGIRKNTNTYIPRYAQLPSHSCRLALWPKGLHDFVPGRVPFLPRAAKRSGGRWQRAYFTRAD